MCSHINMWCGFLLFTLISSVDLLLILFPRTSCRAFPSVIPSSLLLSPPSLPPALSLFLSDQVGLIRWFSVQGNRRLIRATSLRRRTTFSPFPEPFNDHGEVGPWEPFLSVICFIALGQDHCRIVTEPILHSLQCWNSEVLWEQKSSRDDLFWTQCSSPQHRFMTWASFPSSFFRYL